MPEAAVKILEDVLGATPIPMRQLRNDELRFGGDPAQLHAELIGTITEAMAAHPRSQQKRIGPSEMGTPCQRKLAYKLGLVEPVTRDTAGWRARVGTAVHADLAGIFAEKNAALGIERYVMEMEVGIGLVGEDEITGSIDLYDHQTASVVDWKVPGITSLKRVKAHGPGPLYEGQVQIYGLGVENAGLPVDRVHIAFLPQSGDLPDAFLWSAPYDRDRALALLKRSDDLAKIGAQLGWPMVAGIATPTADYCQYCPWFALTNPDPAAGRCPGSPEMVTARERRNVPPTEAIPS
jgi:hypothetical protein